MTDYLFGDFETKSRIDLKKRGLDIYAKHPSTKPLMFAWAVNRDKPALWFPKHGKPAGDLMDALRDPSVVFVAHNLQFELAIFKYRLKLMLDRQRCRDTMIMAHHAGLPGKLMELCSIVGMKGEVAKMKEGYKLMRKFCMPRQANHITDKKPYEFCDEISDPEDWDWFCRYCISDVTSERDLFFKLLPFDLSPAEWRRYRIDQEINERGIPVDPLFVKNAMTMYKRNQKELIDEMRGITGLKNPMSGAQFLPWARARGYPYNDLRKNTVKRAAIDDLNLMDDDLQKVLTIRAEANKASVKKFDAIDRAFNPEDNRLRYQFVFMGASRTGRESGRDAQPQNFASPQKKHKEILEQITEQVREEQYGELSLEHGNVMSVLSSTLRSSFRAPEGKKFIVADLAAIEDRVVGWLARCQQILDDHINGRCPYLSFATHMYNRPYSAFTKKSPERNIAKPGRLGCCYRLSAGEIALNKKGDYVKTGLWGYAESMGVQMTQEQCEIAVKAYRETYTEVVQFWYDLENAAIKCIDTRQPQRVGFLEFDIKAPYLRMKLPSGRYLHYLRPRVTRVEFKRKDGSTYTKRALSYEGVDQNTKQWTRIFTHGGKLCENGTQAVAREVLFEGIEAAYDDEYTIDMHVHDEIVAEEDLDSPRSWKDLAALMSRPIVWAPGLPLAAAGYDGIFYKKE